MPVVLAKAERENLFQEIFNALRQWSELERRVFSQAHYHGQSLEAISRSLQLDVEVVSAILKQCDHRLHATLKAFCESSYEKLSRIPAETARPAACGQDLSEAHAPASRVNHILDISRASF